jgi:glutaconyl-CoA/methylmalonyl-CoA decarboxylase subunit gamma
MKSVKITVNGHPYSVEVGDLNMSPVEVLVDGQKYAVEIEAGEVAAAPVQKQQSATPSVPVAPARAATPVPQAGDANSLRSPMPGQILNVNVKAGDKVVRGQTLMALEAMKMKSAIKSPRDGIIASVAVNDGQKVAYNDVLVTFE